MSRHFSLPVATLFALFFLATCGSSRPFNGADPNNPTWSVIYGYIDMEDAPSAADWVFIVQQEGDSLGYNARTEDSFFYHAGMPPGPYQVGSFGENSIWQGERLYTYTVGTEDGRKTVVQIAQPDVYFMGAYRYASVPTGFEMKQIDGPDERVILTWVLEDLEDTHPEFVHQIDMLRRRLAELS